MILLSYENNIIVSLILEILFDTRNLPFCILLLMQVDNFMTLLEKEVRNDERDLIGCLQQFFSVRPHPSATIFPLHDLVF